MGARRAIKDLYEMKKIKLLFQHSSQMVYTRAIAVDDDAEEEESSAANALSATAELAKESWERAKAPYVRLFSILKSQATLFESDRDEVGPRPHSKFRATFFVFVLFFFSFGVVVPPSSLPPRTWVLFFVPFGSFRFVWIHQHSPVNGHTCDCLRLRACRYPQQTPPPPLVCTLVGRRGTR